jgi:hypothetical protein
MDTGTGGAISLKNEKGNMIAHYFSKANKLFVFHVLAVSRRTDNEES